jgi:hypothetical protein
VRQALVEDVVAHGCDVIRCVAFPSVLRDGTRDSVIKASIQSAKVIRGNRPSCLRCQFGDGLTDITIIVYDLRDGETLTQKVFPVLACGLGNFLVWRCSEAKLDDQLVQEHGHAVVDFRFGRGRL